ncbi:MAG: hypothetical protein R3F62_26665 [Planctomycetota bacterium]
MSALAPGAEVGPDPVLEPLGLGAMGEVHERLHRGCLARHEFLAEELKLLVECRARTGDRAGARRAWRRLREVWPATAEFVARGRPWLEDE